MIAEEFIGGRVGSVWNLEALFAWVAKVGFLTIHKNLDEYLNAKGQKTTDQVLINGVCADGYLLVHML